MPRKKIPTLCALRVLLAPLWSTRPRSAAQRDVTDNSTAPFLVYIVAVLSLILSILVIDLHRDELRALGLVGGTERINPIFMSP